MTPQLSSAVVSSRLVTMRQLLADLVSLGEVDIELLTSDRIVRHAVERILTQLVTLATDINGHIAATVTALPPLDSRKALDAVVDAGVLSAELGDRLRPSIGLRNVLVHEYLEIDLRYVVAATHEAPREYGDYIRAVSAWLARQN